MTDKNTISDYTESEFISLINNLININAHGSNRALGKAMQEFGALIGHPSGTDLIFYPEPGTDDSPEGITKTVKAWRAANGLPGFKGPERQ